MSHILGIETSTDVCSVGIASNGRVRSARSIDEPRRHSELLVELIDSVLNDAGLHKSALTAIAVSAGPGSYTGLRIGVSTAKGLASGLSIPLLAVGTLHALAHAALSAERLPSYLVVAMPARRTELYAQAFNVQQGALEPDSEAEAIAVEDLLERVASEARVDWAVAGPGSDVLLRQASESGLARPVAIEAIPDSRHILSIAGLMVGRGESVEADTFEPYYIKPFVARNSESTPFDRLSF